ncbi:MAG: hypothetical protein V3V08_25230 [Nannocystaceae bacterium]
MGLPDAFEETPDARLSAHVVLPATPSTARLEYAEGIADIHRRADLAHDAGHDRLVEILREGLALPLPGFGFGYEKGAPQGEAELLQLELAARLSEQLVRTPQGAQEARRLLLPLLAPTRSLALDHATARALVVLGHAAYDMGDDALAAGSYSRAISLMIKLQEREVAR